MNQPLYIAAIAALFFVLLSKHLHHIYEVGTEAWFKTFKQNYDKTEWRTPTAIIRFTSYRFGR